MVKDLKSFLGHLCHAASVVRPGRTFLRALFTLVHRTNFPHHYVRLTATTPPSQNKDSNISPIFSQIPRVPGIQSAYWLVISERPDWGSPL